MSDRDYRFPGLPLEPVRAGRTVLVRGSDIDGAAELLLRATDPVPQDGGAVLVSPNATASQLLADRRECGCRVHDRVYVVDCVSRQQGRNPDGERVAGVSTPADLTGVGMRTSAFQRDLLDADTPRIRLGLLSLSTLLMYSELRRVCRFVHVLTGRVAATDGIALLALDDRSHEEQVASTVEQFCDGRVTLRTDDDERQVRVAGLSGQPSGWVPFD